VVCEQKVRDAGLGRLITNTKTDHQHFGTNCALDAIGNAMRSSKTANAQLRQQVTGGGGFVRSIAILAEVLVVARGCRWRALHSPRRIKS
jgi:hypothetical protein